MDKQKKEPEYTPYIKAMKEKTEDLEKMIDTGSNKSFMLLALDGAGTVDGKQADTFLGVARGKKKYLAAMLALAMNDKDFMYVLALATRLRLMEQKRRQAMAKMLNKIEPFQA